MLVFECLQMICIQTPNNLVILPATFGGDGRSQHCRNDKLLISYLNPRVTERRDVSNSEVGRQSPRCRRPNHDEYAGATDDRKFHKDTLADMILVFDFRLGQGRSARNAPINRLLAAVYKTLFYDFGKQKQFLGFV